METPKDSSTFAKEAYFTGDVLRQDIGGITVIGELHLYDSALDIGETETWKQVRQKAATTQTIIIEHPENSTWLRIAASKGSNGTYIRLAALNAQAGRTPLITLEEEKSIYDDTVAFRNTCIANGIQLSYEACVALKLYIAEATLRNYLGDKTAEEIKKQIVDSYGVQSTDVPKVLSIIESLKASDRANAGNTTEQNPILPLLAISFDSAVRELSMCQKVKKLNLAPENNVLIVVGAAHFNAICDAIDNPTLPLNFKKEKHSEIIRVLSESSKTN